MFAYRTADARRQIFDPTGAMLYGGRWNAVGQHGIYAAETYAGALLEVLVHANLSQVPKNHMAITITIPGEIIVEAVSAEDLGGWDAEDMLVSRAFGERWFRENRTAVLKVPSAVTGGRESNIVLNTVHSQFSLLTASAPEPVRWDLRLFGMHVR